jgi:hypothetical protein
MHQALTFQWLTNRAEMNFFASEGIRIPLATHDVHLLVTSPNPVSEALAKSVI